MSNPKDIILSNDKVVIDSGLYDDNHPIMRSSGRTFIGWNGDTSVKSHYTRNDYEHFRKTTEGKTRQGILKIGQEAYDNIGIIQNVINLMSDFGSKGIRIRHSNKDINKFCEKFSKKVNVAERSERFLNIFYRLGSVVVYESYGRAINSITSKYIPIKYTFLNPASVEVKDEDKGIIPTDFGYVLRYSNRVLRQPNNSDATVTIPEELKKYKNGIRPLPNNRISVYNYRKNDWDFWGLPITYPIFHDLKTLEKLKLSDISALDGVISSVRVWNVGKLTDNPQTTILPTKPMLEKVRNMVAHGVGGGSMDLVVGPEISFTESNTNLHQFLGEAKYKPTLDAIYDGLGIPSPLRSSNKDNNNASAISLKTLIERLNYGRMQLIDFWTKQIKNIFTILEFDTDEDPIIEFDYMVLTDEAAEKKLLLDMIDRDIIDIETVHERMNITSPITKENLKREVSERGNESPVKAGPFHNAHIEDDMKKMLLQAGQVIPDEIGLDIKVSKTEQQKRLKQQQKAQQQATLSKKQFSDVPGRPKNITETKKREPKSTKATIWASQAQKQISDIYTPIVLKIYNKKNVRSLSVAETNSLEEAKAKILMAIEPFEEINEKVIYQAIAKKSDIKDLKDFWDNFDDMELNVDQKRQLTSIFYGAIHGQD